MKNLETVKLPEFYLTPILVLTLGNYAELLKHGSCGILKLIKSRTLTSEVEIDDTPELAALKGTVVRIYDNDSRRKVQAVKILLEDYLDELTRHKSGNGSYQMHLLIPESKYLSRRPCHHSKNRFSNCSTHCPLHWQTR